MTKFEGNTPCNVRTESPLTPVPACGLRPRRGQIPRKGGGRATGPIAASGTRHSRFLRSLAFFALLLSCAGSARQCSDESRGSIQNPGKRVMRRSRDEMFPHSSRPMAMCPASTRDCRARYARCGDGALARACGLGAGAVEGPPGFNTEEERRDGGPRRRTGGQRRRWGRREVVHGASRGAHYRSRRHLRLGSGPPVRLRGPRRSPLFLRVEKAECRLPVLVGLRHRSGGILPCVGKTPCTCHPGARRASQHAACACIGVPSFPGASRTGCG